MNTRQKLTKWTSIMVLVAIASLATAGLALADHEIPVVGIERGSQAAFEQYTAVLEHMEEELNAALFASFSAKSSAARFDQYNAAIEQMIESSEAVFATTVTRQSDDSGLRFAQYLQYAK